MGKLIIKKDPSPARTLSNPDSRVIEIFKAWGGGGAEEDEGLKHNSRA